MPLCGSQACQCSIVGDEDTITITGSGDAGDPYVISGSPIPNPAVQVYSASTSWSKPTGIKYVIVEVVGAGGGSGGAATTGASQAAAGGGGGGGGYSCKLILASALGSSETVTVGTGGAAGLSGANDGGTGGSSSFGSHCSANGGAGGTGGAVRATGNYCDNGGVGGTATGGDINVQGGRGRAVVAAAGRMIRAGGGSAAGRFGLDDSNSTVTATGAAGATGTAPGQGAAGGTNCASQVSRAGAAGADGTVVVWEVY